MVEPLQHAIKEFQEGVASKYSYEKNLPAKGCAER